VPLPDSKLPLTPTRQPPSRSVLHPFRGHPHLDLPPVNPLRRPFPAPTAPFRPLSRLSDGLAPDPAESPILLVPSSPGLPALLPTLQSACQQLSRTIQRTVHLGCHLPCPGVSGHKQHAHESVRTWMGGRSSYRPQPYCQYGHRFMAVCNWVKANAI
jgi:hypothetical protein